MDRKPNEEYKNSSVKSCMVAWGAKRAHLERKKKKRVDNTKKSDELYRENKDFSHFFCVPFPTYIGMKPRHKDANPSLLTVLIAQSANPS